MAARVLSLDLAQGPTPVTGLDGYMHALVLFRWGKRVLGSVRLPVRRGALDALTIWRAAHAELGDVLAEHAARELLHLVPPTPPLPSASIVICTHERPDDLRRCLLALHAQLTTDPVEILVIDNAPRTQRTQEVARELRVRCVVEPRQGLNWARACGLRTARGSLVLFTDDDALPEPEWLDAMRRPFATPEVALVCGLVLPYELETEAQEAYEQHGGFRRGFVRREFTAGTLHPLGAAAVGAGASMAVRRELALELGLFDCEMDCGTVTRSGGDTYACFQLLSLGHTLVYEPEAVSFHRHRTSDADLVSTLHGYAVGTYVFFLRALLLHGEWEALRGGASWFVTYHLRQLLRSVAGRAGALPLHVVMREIQGVLVSPVVYVRARRRERQALAERAGIS